MIASAVAFAPEPAITGTRPAVCSMQISVTRICSSNESVGDSPVVPQGTKPLLPSAICQSMKFRNAASSTAPSRNGVISAVNEP